MAHYLSEISSKHSTPSNLDKKPDLPEITVKAIDFEEQQWTNGPVTEDDFYTLPADYKGNLQPGALLKLQSSVDTSKFTIPPGTALSRLIYISKTLSGRLVPVSAYVLWPYSPRTLTDGFAIVAWAHGTSGSNANSAPSHLKTLWQHFLAPFQLALQGYVVVATDYAGLGVSKDENGKEILHEYLSCPSHANDVVYSVQAAQEAFPRLSKKFVFAGHSQGGGAAWAVAQRQVLEPVDGYLGAIAVSPVTDLFEAEEPILSMLGMAICDGIAEAFDGFDVRDILTEQGYERYKLVKETGAWLTTSLTLVTGVELMKKGWIDNEFVKKWREMTSNGGKEISGPLLVIRGEADVAIKHTVVTKAIDVTLDRFPSSRIECLLLPGISHNATMCASQWKWMNWIEGRFHGKEVAEGAHNDRLQPERDIESYQAELNWFIKPAEAFYEVP